MSFLGTIATQPNILWPSISVFKLSNVFIYLPRVFMFIITSKIQLFDSPRFELPEVSTILLTRVFWKTEKDFERLLKVNLLRRWFNEKTVCTPTYDIKVTPSSKNYKFCSRHTKTYGYWSWEIVASQQIVYSTNHFLSGTPFSGPG